MSIDKVNAIIGKEFDEIMKNKYILGSLVAVPLLFSLLLPASLIAPAVFYPEAYLDANETSYIATALGKSQEALISFFMNAVIPFFMMLPAILPTIVASYSIIGEKKNRTLEPLLAAPVSVYDILAGKALSAIIPALAATWISAILFCVITGAITYTGLHRIIFPDIAVWLLGMLVLAPLLAFMGIMIAIIVSSRVNDPRVAQQISAVLVVPIMSLFIGQMAGFVLIDLKVMVGAAMLILALDAVVLILGKSMFDREEILTRWK
ncbi:ABC-2 type transporter [Methanocella conradii HZ254]|uniref:ABC-2 type transporter n=1 Tax=Methanocella conradii (strain DSM 24694 / JCM 17849 / CGMCC 1.5162 / HZ254) TaxID=1041930 RepID=H8IAY6_METCZ|nr:ABC transporter permease subunit [Methanocella conradii]AFD00996.1 ABC-2 type transporter [Methanocella conradii HZ254]MDI6897655.1 ABC transporter permease subunit [Methanocella conradii]